MLGQLPSLPVQAPLAVKCAVPQSLNPNRETYRRARRLSPGAALRGPVEHWPCVDAANARRNTSGRPLRATRGEPRSRAKVDQRWPRPARLQRRVKIAPSRAVAAPQQGWSLAPAQGRSRPPIAKPRRAPVAAQARTLAALPAIWPPRPVREPPVREHLPAPRSQHAWSLVQLHAWSLVQLPWAGVHVVARPAACAHLPLRLSERRCPALQDTSIGDGWRDRFDNTSVDPGAPARSACLCSQQRARLL